MSTLKTYWAAIAPVQGAIWLASFYFLFSLVYIVVFTRHFNADPLVIPLHLFLVTGISSITILLSGLPLTSDAFRNWRMARFVTSLMPALFFTILVFLYIANFISNSFWGSNINYRITALYAFRIDEVVKALPISSLWVYLPLSVLVLLIATGFLLASGPIFRSLVQFFSRHGSHSLLKDRSGRIKYAVLFLVGTIFFIEYTYILWSQRSSFVDVSQEPILGFLVPPSSSVAETHSTFLIRIEDKEARQRYPHNQRLEKKNVVLIIADSLRADHMQVYGYERPTTPFLNSLYEAGSLKRVNQALSTCAETVCGVMSVLSSKDSTKLFQGNFTLHDVLHDMGYSTYFILSGAHDWYGLREYYGEDIDLYFDGASSKSYSLNDDNTLFEGLEKVPDYAENAAFFYFHVMSPHHLGTKYPQYCRYLPAEKKIEPAAMMTGSYAFGELVDNYDDRVTQTDGVIQRLFDTLRRKGYLKDSIVVITGDHGDGLGEHGHVGHTLYAYQEQISIPFLIYDEDGRNYVNLEAANQIDIAPTILDRLGLVIPSCWEGTSILSHKPVEYSYHVSSGSRVGFSGYRCYVVIYRTGKEEYKYIRSMKTREEELFELISDPLEQRDLSKENAGLVQTLREKCRAHYSELAGQN